MLIMLIKFDGVLNGTEPLLESDLETDPAGQMLGINTYLKEGTLGRIDPDLAFAGQERHEGYRLDLVHVQQQNQPASGLVEVATPDGEVLFFATDLSAGVNVHTEQQAVFVPPGYVVQITSDAPSGGNIIRLGLTPLVGVVDWQNCCPGQDLAAVVPPE
jgi:hypothetical protein